MTFAEAFMIAYSLDKEDSAVTDSRTGGTNCFVESVLRQANPLDTNFSAALTLYNFAGAGFSDGVFDFGRTLFYLATSEERVGLSTQQPSLLEESVKHFQMSINQLDKEGDIVFAKRARGALEQAERKLAESKAKSASGEPPAISSTKTTISVEKGKAGATASAVKRKARRRTNQIDWPLWPEMYK